MRLHPAGSAGYNEAAVRGGNAVRWQAINRLSPIRMIRPVFRAAGALELPAGTLSATGTEKGDLVEFVGSSS